MQWWAGLITRLFLTFVCEVSERMSCPCHVTVCLKWHTTGRCWPPPSDDGWRATSGVRGRACWRLLSVRSNGSYALFVFLRPIVIPTKEKRRIPADDVDLLIKRSNMVRGWLFGATLLQLWRARHTLSRLLLPLPLILTLKGARYKSVCTRVCVCVPVFNVNKLRGD